MGITINVVETNREEIHSVFDSLASMTNQPKLKSTLLLVGRQITSNAVMVPNKILDDIQMKADVRYLPKYTGATIGSIRKLGKSVNWTATTRGFDYTYYRHEIKGKKLHWGETLVKGEVNSWLNLIPKALLTR